MRDCKRAGNMGQCRQLAQVEKGQGRAQVQFRDLLPWASSKIPPGPQGLRERVLPPGSRLNYNDVDLPTLLAGGSMGRRLAPVLQGCDTTMVPHGGLATHPASLRPHN